MPSTRPTRTLRHAAVAAVAAVAALVAACTPAPEPAPPTVPALPPLPPLTAPTLPPSTTRPPSSTTTVPGGSFTCPTRSSSVAEHDSVGLGDVVELTAAELATAADTATVEGAGQPVTVTVVDAAGQPEILSVPADAIDATIASLDDTHSVVGVEAPVATASVGTATDPKRPDQWGFNSIKFEDTWVCSRGAGVTVAVIDTGVDGAHAELSGRVSTGYTKLNARPGSTGGANTDPNGHGTHVAGTVAASANNGVGVAGVAPEASILPVKVLDSNGDGFDVDAAAGIIWATDNGADVINLSLTMEADTTAMRTAVAYAHTNGVVVVAAAGNSGTTETIYPAAYPGVIGVGATTSAATIATFSTRGSHVDVVAPGQLIISTLPDGLYGYKSGTSMASPHVAGVAALVIGARGTVAGTVVEDRITSTAADAGVPGRDDAYGFGFIDPVRAVGN